VEAIDGFVEARGRGAGYRSLQQSSGDGSLWGVNDAIVRDRLWLWGHDAGRHNEGWGLPRPSRIGPVEAAEYLGIENLIMVPYGDGPFVPPAGDFVRYRRMKRLVWSIVGPVAAASAEEREAVVAMSTDLPNLAGVVMDDFFRVENVEAGRDAGMLAASELARFRDRLRNAPHPLDIWVVLYADQLDLPVRRHLELCDKVTFWTSQSDVLKDLEANLSRAEALAPAAGRLLGCYLWNYGKKQPLPLDLMEWQCERGLAWLRSGRIEGIIFLASCVCDLDLETVEWTREWIHRNGGGSA